MIKGERWEVRGLPVSSRTVYWGTGRRTASPRHTAGLSAGRTASVSGWYCWSASPLHWTLCLRWRSNLQQDSQLWRLEVRGQRLEGRVERWEDPRSQVSGLKSQIITYQQTRTCQGTECSGPAGRSSVGWQWWGWPSRSSRCSGCPRPWQGRWRCCGRGGQSAGLSVLWRTRSGSSCEEEWSE